ncbi:MAG: RNA 2',3'-cyclic phosphodiesterase [Chloroflexi bacterium]|nr:RNA 2',3'-cyclic phosphodiesterase [Chloroflexota bacterium]
MREEGIRAFVTIELPDPLRRVIGELVDGLWADSGSAVRWVDPAGVHLTLKFLGSVAQEQVAPVGEAVRAATRGLAPFCLESNSLGGFPHLGAPAVIWLGLSGDAESLLTLQKALEDSLARLGFQREGRPFHPHLTLGRVKERASPGERRRIGRLVASFPSPAPLRFEVSGISLMRSDLTPQGARYTRLLAHPLKEGSGNGM